MALSIQRRLPWPFGHRKLRTFTGQIFQHKGRRYIVSGITTTDDGGRLWVSLECYEIWCREKRGVG